MSKFPDKKDEVTDWLSVVSQLSPDEFCRNWIPIIYGINESDKTYRAACIDLLQRIFNKQKKTIENWLWNPQMVPEYVQQQLGLIDRLWQIRQRVISSDP
ncbi:hypothetical protein PCC7424_5638 (plasmid) [Gloeothece citriformis PCC 7424]|uniref:Uncharacterized protein n=1 Tax=Gloeothece citriformis (strain PCC 7424) TaxID=65393 RepID=B7KLP2_GLOC7|nr:hypothetical protein [Gloeothece citriformis]ACK73714.1 hypothetical protein PCC7424_5638 [Gloeothece citriformis PCC 7424]